MQRRATTANTAELNAKDLKLLFLPTILKPDDPFKVDLGLVEVLGIEQVSYFKLWVYYSY